MITCKFCGGSLMGYVEEYCHACGDPDVCFQCLDDEWCPGCNSRWAASCEPVHGFDWQPEQQRQLRRQEIKDAVIGCLAALIVVGWVAIATGVIGG